MWSSLNAFTLLMFFHFCDVFYVSWLLCYLCVMLIQCGCLSCSSMWCHVVANVLWCLFHDVDCLELSFMCCCLMYVKWCDVMLVMFFGLKYVCWFPCVGCLYCVTIFIWNSWVVVIGLCYQVRHVCWWVVNVRDLLFMFVAFHKCYLHVCCLLYDVFSTCLMSCDFLWCSFIWVTCFDWL